MLGLRQLKSLYLNLFTNCPLFPFPQGSKAVVGCYFTFPTPKVWINSAVPCLVRSGEALKPHWLMQGMWLNHCVTEYRSLQWLPDRSQLEPRLKLLQTVSRGWEVPCFSTKVRGFQGSNTGSLKRSYARSCTCVRVHSLMHEVSKALPCCSVM